MAFKRKNKQDGQTSTRPRFESETEGFRPLKTWLVLTVVLLLLIHIGLAFFSLKDKSPTVDEFAHLTAGAYYLKTGDFSLYGKNPPLAKLWCGWPLLAAGAKVRGEPSFHEAGDWRPWIYGTQFMRDNPEQYHRLFIYGRLPNLLFSACLGLVVFFWAQALFGPRGGLIALLVYSLSPNMLGHARLVTPDLSLSLFTTLTLFLLWRFYKRPAVGSATLTGLSLGMALLSKFTGLLLLPLFLILYFVEIAFRPAGQKKIFATKGAAGLVAACLIALLVLNIGYGLRETPTNVRQMPVGSRFFQGISQSPLSAFPWPVPQDYLEGFDRQQRDVEEGVFPNYLNGRFSQEGWWYYFSYAWLLKTPLAVQIALLLALGLWGWDRFRGLKNIAYLLFPVVLLWVILSFFNNINAGLRYLLPAFPLIFVFIGSLGRFQLGPRLFKRILVVFLIGLFLADSLMAFPHYLAYFNPVFTSRSKARFHLIDSNLDWGQDLKHLKTFMDRQGLDKITLAYFGHADPKIYGIDFDMASNIPAEAPLAASVNLVMGLPYPATYVDPPVWITPETLAWLRDRKPDAQVGYSILIYNL
ncbi:MAG: glycosyltransferase family 39 protein, partial [Deltaproteobacteria bacterium]|nr:glycosyltransferase family 39 protein [Deltaproteobacteria bacterium]